MSAAAARLNPVEDDRVLFVVYFVYSRQYFIVGAPTHKRVYSDPICGGGLHGNDIC